MQVSITVPPIAELYFPVGQEEHSDIPLLCPYLPRPHAMHELDPGGLYFPFPHSRHVSGTVAPTSVEYFPPRQYVHSPNPPLSEDMKRPALHGVHAVAPVLFIAVPRGQAKQVDAVSADDVVEYRPIPQRVQEIDPGSGE